jgi:hypothetical protein
MSSKRSFPRFEAPWLSLEFVFDLSPEKLNVAKETGSARSAERVDTQHLESMTPE